MRLLVELLQYAGVLFAELLLRSLPPRGIEALTRAAGTAWYRLDGRRRRRARASIGVARRGGLAVDDPDQLALAACRSLIQVPVEAMVFTRFIRTASQFKKYCRFVGDIRGLQEDVASGRGGLLVCGHLGNWETAAWAAQFLGVPARIVIRPIENRFIDRRALGSRGGEHATITKRGAVRTMLQTLREKLWIATMADQNGGRRGEFIPFFGLEASTYVAPAVLAVRVGVPMYAVSCLRVPGRWMNFRIHLKRLEDPGPAVPDAERARALIEGYVRALEGYIRLAPDQYNWIHRRWKTRPPGEVPGDHLPDYAEFQ